MSFYRGCAEEERGYLDGRTIEHRTGGAIIATDGIGRK